MNTEFNGFPSYIAMTFEEMTRACYDKETLKIPSDEEIKEIQETIQTMQLAGRIIGGGGTFTCLGVSYMVWHIPRFGRGLSLMAGLTAIGIGTFGYHVTVSAQRLQEFANQWIKKNIYNTNELAATKMINIEFRKKMLKTAIEDLALLRILYKGAIAQALSADTSQC